MRRHGPVIAHCTDSEDFPVDFLDVHSGVRIFRLGFFVWIKHVLRVFTLQSANRRISFHSGERDVLLMLMTHLPETRASNPALETRKCDMLSSAGFYLAQESSAI